ncbi:hypothetical protein L1987_74798 [Smallanthus sonchifolius]|uniref:Uncharacterized protein n=1 Tax=Smallanthus sonchifolius TaxID=185202 RepID=A0ACB9A437_9ASTR|nr:hypothetical protein L1987_74798 [Smallanthus sonchifolius]
MLSLSCTYFVLTIGNERVAEILLAPQASSSLQYEPYKNCARSFTCGTISGVQYPFTRHEDPGYCGYPGFELNCNGRNSPTIDMNNLTYHVLSIDHSSQILKIIREDVLVLPGEQGPGICNKSVIVPVPVMGIGSTGLVNSSGLDRVLREGFEVRWKLDTMGCSKCSESNGRCFYSYDTNQTVCACPGSPLIADSCTMVNTSQSSSSPKNSFGVVLMELLSSLRAVDTSRHTRDVNLANMTVDRIQNGKLGELVDERIGFENDGLVRRVVTLVAELGFRCLQRERDMRPTMREVVEGLRGIQNEELNVQKPEVVDIVVDDGGNPGFSDSRMAGD